MEMRELENMWSNATVEDKAEYANLPDGKYQVVVDSCRFTRTKQTELPMFSWDMIVATGQYKDRHVFHNRVLRDADSIQWARQEFHNLGLDANSISELTDNLGQILDCVIEITLKTKKGNTGEDYQNCYINKMVNSLGQEISDDKPIF